MILRKTCFFLIKVFHLFVFFLRGGVPYAKYLGVKIGSGCRIYTFRLGSEPFLIEIGNRVTITSGVRILTHDGSTWLFRDEMGRRYKYQKVIIGNNVFVGVNSIIMPGVIIEDKVIVGAGSVVTKSIPSGSIVAGNPAKIIGKYDDFEKKAISDFFAEKDLDLNLPYKENVLSILDKTPKGYLSENE